MITDILIDADTLLYRVGFSNPSDASIACIRLEKSINEIYGKVVDIHGSSGKLFNTVVFFTKPDGSRYRDKFNNKTKYKENRAGGPSPVFMDEMRQYIRENFVANESPSSLYEADDAISWWGWHTYVNGNPSIICGVDKDLNQIPGYHLDYGNWNSYSLDVDAANYYFFKQLLTGDVADNIPGIKGIGPKKAEKLLGAGNNADEWWDITLAAYTKHYVDATPEELSDMLYERGNKLWIQRYEGQTWYPPIPENRPF